MTRRLLAAACLAMIAGSGIAAAPAVAHTEDESIICIGGDNQRKPGYYQGICLHKLVNVGH